MLEIVTRCTRPENLIQLEKSISLQNSKNFNWNIIFDTSIVKIVPTEVLSTISKYQIYYWEGVEGDMGHGLLNKFLETVENDSWVYFLDDDSTLHHDLISEFNKFLESSTQKEGFIFSQEVGGRDFTGLQKRVASPENVAVQKIDMSQFILKKSMIGEVRFKSMTYAADGFFIEEIYQKSPEKFHFTDKVLSHYNNLNLSDSKWSLPRVLAFGERRTLETTSFSPHEETNLKILWSDKKRGEKDLIDFDPDCVVTLDREFQEYNFLCNKPLDTRLKWLHGEVTGDQIYFASMDYILKRKYSEIEISVFTPLFKTGEKLKRTYQSLKNQTYTEWEWVLISDSSDQRTLQIARSIAAKDPRVKVYQIEPFSNSTIGESKYRACALSNGKHLLELDHDDYLLPHAIEETLKAFKNFPDVGFVYSDCAEIDEQWRSLTYGESFSFGYGSYREEVHLGRKFQVADCANINPITIRHIVGVPNHLRVWKREVYFQVGGHNRKLRIADDYELILRTFLKTKMLKIAKCCYLQFQNGENSQNASRKDIQRRVRTIAFHYNEKIRARFEELGKIDWAYRPDGNFSNLEKPLNEEHVNYTS